MENGLQTVLMVSPVGSADGGVAQYLKSGEVDGAIFFALHSDALVTKLKKQGKIVLVVSHRENLISNVDSVIHFGVIE